VPSAAELDRLVRGEQLKRHIRAAAALRGLYEDTDIAERVGRTRITVGQWWRGAQPDPASLVRLAEATGLSPDELMRFVYQAGPPPTIVPPASAAAEAIREGIRRDRARPLPEDPEGPAPSPVQRPPGRRGAPS